MTNILMTGGTGFVGSNFIKYYKNYDKNCKIYNLGRTENKDCDKNIYWDMLEEPSVDVVSKLSKLKDLDIDVILHCGSIVGEKEISPKDYMKVNVMSTIDLLDFAFNNKIKRFIYISTGSVYDTNGEKTLTETSPCDPIGMYSMSKYMSEKICKDYEKYYGMNMTILRLFYPYGPGQKYGRLIPSLITHIKEKSPIIVNKDYSPKLNPIYINDAVGIIGYFVGNNRIGTYNVCGREELSVFDITQKIGDFLKIHPLYRIKKAHTNDVVGSMSKFCSGAPSWGRSDIWVPFNDGLEKTIKFMYPEIVGKL